MIQFSLAVVTRKLSLTAISAGSSESVGPSQSVSILARIVDKNSNEKKIQSAQVFFFVTFCDSSKTF